MSRIHVVAASHGTDSPAGQQLIHELRSQLETRAAGRLPSQLVWHEAYVDVQQPQLPAVLSGLPAGEPAVVLPLLVADGVHTTQDIAQAVREREQTVAAHPLGALPALCSLLSDRSVEHLAGADEIVLAAAGTRLAAGQEQIRQLAALVQAELDRPVSTAYCAGAEPRVADVVAAARGRQVLVLSALLAEGYFQDKLRSTGAWQVTKPLLPDVMITQCFLERLFEALEAHGWVTKNDEVDRR